MVARIDIGDVTFSPTLIQLKCQESGIRSPGMPGQRVPRVARSAEFGGSANPQQAVVETWHLECQVTAAHGERFLCKGIDNSQRAV